MQLSRYLAVRGIRLSDFASTIGRSPGTVHDLLCGRRMPSMALMVAIAEATGGDVQPNDWMPAKEPAA